MSLSANDLTYEFHDELNPAVWDGDKLKPEIKDKLLEIAEAFAATFKFDLEVEDIVLTGSLANFNYTKYSDFDLHIVTDLDLYDKDKRLLQDYFKVKKTNWNTTHDIKIKGYDVEVYIQDISEPHHSSGIYSIKNDNWLIEPVKVENKNDVDLSVVSRKKQNMLDMINFALTPECSIADAESVKDKIMALRKAGLEIGGEFSPENLAFKELRRSGDIERMVKGIIAKTSKHLSLDSTIREDTFKPFADFLKFNTKRGPRHRSPNAGIRKLMSPEVKSLSMVAQMHKITELPAIHRLKKMAHGIISVPPEVAHQIAADYNLDMRKIQGGTPSALSTSGSVLGIDPRSNVFYLRK